MRLNEYNAKINKKTGLTELYKVKGFLYNNCTVQSVFFTSRDVVNLMNIVYSLNEKAEEYVYMISLNTKSKPFAIFEVSHGTVNTSLMPIREIFIRALLSGAVSIIIVHNHPSGDPTPSPQDIQITKKVKEAGEIIGISLQDHIIIGDNNCYYSFYDNDFL
jgi:DNA repair protein RadC